MQGTLTGALAEPASLRNGDQRLALLITAAAGILPDVRMQTLQHIGWGDLHCHCRQHCTAGTQPGNELFGQLCPGIADPADHAAACHSQEGRQTAQIPAPPLEQHDQHRTAVHIPVIPDDHEAQGLLFVLLGGDGGGAQQDEYGL